MGYVQAEIWPMVIRVSVRSHTNEWFNGVLDIFQKLQSPPLLTLSWLNYVYVTVGITASYYRTSRR